MDLLQKDVPILAKIYEAKCFYDSQNNRIILYYKNHVTARTLVDVYNLPTTPPPNSSLYVIYDLQTGTFNVSTDSPTYTVSNSKVYVTSPINAEYDMDKVIIYRISWYEKDSDIDLNHIPTQLSTTDIDLNHILTKLNTFDTFMREQQANTNHILTQLNTFDNFIREQQANTNYILTKLDTFDTFVQEQQANTNYILTQLNTFDNFVREQQTNINHILTQLNTFVRKQQADTITATHTFDPTQPGPAFQLGPNARNQLIRYLNADKVDGFDASQTPAPNTIPVADNSGTLLPAWIPSMFNSVVVISPSANTIYQETAPCLIMVVSPELSGLQISPNGITWYGYFGQRYYYPYHYDYYYYYGDYRGVITFYVPKNWYWMFSSVYGYSYWLKFVFNY
jgi:hypothetical protein